MYAPPGSVIPKSKMKLKIAKIRGVESHGMLCSESELNISDESEGITELPSKKYNNQIGKKFFKNNSPKVIDLSITPNRADCLGVRGVARDLSAAGAGKLKKFDDSKIKFRGLQKIKVKISKEKNQGCSTFGSCLINGIKNTESPKWLKDKILSFKPEWVGYTSYTANISAIKIISEKKSRSLSPDYYLVMPWQFKKEFIDREKII